MEARAYAVPIREGSIGTAGSARTVLSCPSFRVTPGWRVAQAAGWLAFDHRTVASGSVADLERQGLVRRTARTRPGNLVGVVAYRCAAFERVRPQGINLAWTFDPLASASNRALRAHRARQRRLVAQAMAEDRRALAPVPPGGRPDPRDRFALTPAGRAALAAAEARARL